jgi:hypothetical protein
MDKMRDPSKQVARNHPKYREWVKFLSTIEEEAHRFNSQRPSSRKTADYLVRHFDATGRAMLETVGDYSSALLCGKVLDDLVLRVLAWFRRWIRAAALPPSKRPSRKVHNDLRKRLMRRAEHWKAEAHACVSWRSHACLYCSSTKKLRGDTSSNGTKPGHCKHAP